MADKWDEITQLEEAYNALKSQDRPAQLRMLEWLRARLQNDFDVAMDARAEALRTAKHPNGEAKP